MGLAWGDGGALVLHQRAGSVNISLFASPSPLRAGMADLSVLLQDGETQEILLNGVIELELSKPDEKPIRVDATQGQATNRLLYAASVDLPSAGKWDIAARCRVGREQVVVRGQLTVLTPESPIFDYWAYFLIVPLAISLFALNQVLKTRRRSARLPTRP
jgi:hypothetical protein